MSEYEIFDGEEGEIVDKIKEVTTTNTIVFKANDRFFRIKFTLPTFDKVHKTLYAWKIEGVYDDWTYQKQNSLQFGALPYGEHVLRIKGQGVNGGWSPHELTLKIEALKPFYLQFWFLILAILLIAVTIIGFFKSRTILLKNEIEKATTTIAQQADELRVLDKLKSRFFANVSHELRTPLALMLGPIKRLIRKNGHDEEERKLLDFLERSTHHLKSLVNEILDLSKLENNKMELHEEPVLFCTYIKEHLSQFYSIGDSESIKIYSDLNVDESLNLLLDKGKFTKVINNFLSNAIKFTSLNGKVIIRAKDEGKNILIEVKDTGRGIHENDLPHVFDRFYQSKVGNAPAEGGTGIGLSLCRELSELMGGKVWVESVLGEGSSFFFQFPKKVTHILDVQLPTTITKQIAIDHQEE